MPLTAAICSVPVFAAMLCLPAGLVITSSTPVSSDIYAVLGAMIASILALVEARKKDRTVGHTISVFVGSASVGSFLPGVLVYLAKEKGWMDASTVEGIIWQGWALMGILCGLNAWWLLHGANRYLQKRAEKLFRDDPPA